MGSPERYIHPEEAVHCDSHETQNWDQGQQDGHTAEEETDVEWSLYFAVHEHRQRYGHEADQKVGHGQTDDEAEGGLVKAFTGPQRQNDQCITKTAANGNQQLQEHVDHCSRVHCALHPAQIWR